MDMRDFHEIYALTMERGQNRFQEKNKISAVPCYCTYSDLAGRVLSTDINSDRDLPPFNRVAMDGYACLKDDIHQPLDIIGTVAAGERSSLTVKPGTCIKVMTGAVLPSGAEIVIMVESTVIDSDGRMVFKGSDVERNNGNFSHKGEDVSAGERILNKGRILSPKHTALLASVGVTQIPVRPLPRVGILSTGDEVVKPEEQPLPHQIRNANAPQLVSLLMEMHISPVNYDIVSDDIDSLTETISWAQTENDVVLMSGGVSMGDFDLAPNAMKNCGFRILYDRVAVKPGKPTTFAVSDRADLFGLPGNPVSCFVIFHLLVKPYIYRMMGAVSDPPGLTAVMSTDFTRKKTARDEWIPVSIEGDGTATPIPYHGSGHYYAVAQADGMVMIHKGSSILEKGSTVALRLF